MCVKLFALQPQLPSYLPPEARSFEPPEASSFEPPGACLFEPLLSQFQLCSAVVVAFQMMCNLKMMVMVMVVALH